MEANVTDRVLSDDIEDVIVSEEQIKLRVRELGRQISEDYRGKDLMLVGILRGAFVFLADLIREMGISVETDFIAISSYGSASTTSGVVRILKDLDDDIADKHVLIVEDILDTGLTLNYLIKNLSSRRPASLEICSFIVKEGKQRVPIRLKYSGFTVPNTFVVGYGLDYAQMYRNLPFIGTLKRSVYEDDAIL
ncbi:MAG: hypoxanthine phosphoribosyltransferase [Candidatus Aquicultor secundus]|uniref:Hypoxanthine phosphoribosyltransferase n=2 Tax=Candidatus Aquicultor secundus TaxID=1973895 RepID=A0A2M7T961_9ACTN|nr:hypoxanthine phosphoribosyltransferase [Candidatus Aquicultor secundus]NCO66030.1 hypoxanthine phosphoribosyltransferase [Solirubrobacter sp.]OIO85365.1 MAG: hypoxanthine phosphoribosyltransferase [Candidatus Aquicultor secundus]PIU27152.1 MAG: hypoxanthine phosphoribosyltransferase [Candidatus Aquicultor secundus]PIW22776.1 MAG: hypoxanthine phosphoribosyltransferase [Candidatus Aquicultor secundus]PIX51937.1 MAG: hypoxanthine phosphoribosyltransferase [Candidatus Aquicultor secundus]